MSDDEVFAKFHAVAGRILPNEQVARIAQLVIRLDDVDDIGELIDAWSRVHVTSRNARQLSSRQQAHAQPGSATIHPCAGRRCALVQGTPFAPGAPMDRL